MVKTRGFMVKTRGFMVKTRGFMVKTRGFMGALMAWSRALIRNSWFYGQNSWFLWSKLVVLWSKLVVLWSKLVGQNGRPFVAQWSPLRGPMVKTSWPNGRGALGLSKGLLRFSWISKCVQEYGSRVGWGFYG